MRLVQIRNRDGQRRVGAVNNGTLQLLDGVDSIYALCQEAFATRQPLNAHAEERVSRHTLPYDDIYGGRSDWRILPAMDHPDEPARCLVTGTGLTHVKSAQNRQAMHKTSETPTDSMRMYQWGIEGGHPGDGEIGIAPEWFYKGCGTGLRAHGEPLVVPPHAEDGGEEPEIVGVYVVDPSGQPRRIGMAIGNEFSNHKFEKKNYLYLAGSKLMPCAIGPELVIDADFNRVPGEVLVEREGNPLWRREIVSGEAVMSHSVANLEHHHFKYAAHRRPGDVHIHFFGADAFSFGEGISLQNGDQMQIRFEGFGRPLRNPLSIDPSPQKLCAAVPL
ncbi:MAG TPA: AraD1 family protein [Candidatus Acidoferrales bacterium]